MTAKLPKQQLNSELLRQRLVLKNASAERKLLTSHSAAREFFSKLELRPGKIRQHAAKLLTSGALAGTLLLSGMPVALPLVAGNANNPLAESAKNNDNQNLTPTPQLQNQLAQLAQSALPSEGTWQLTRDQEKRIQAGIKNIWGITAKPELDGHRLNNDYGRMGAEQHLPRFPGDDVYQHENLVDKGITPGLGGWGYFAYSKDLMTPELYANEKYYVAVQTLYLPDWNTHTKELVDWYKYRKVVVVNPQNGKTIVADVADAGPAIWTGKHFGGSPEVMAYLGINTGMQNHPVVLFFLDDPNKEIPLGPVEYNWDENKKMLANKD